MTNSAFQAWVEVLPDFRNFSRKASSEMSDILGAAGTAGGITAGRNIGDGLLGGIRGLAGPIIGAVAALGIGRAIGDAIGSGIRYTLDSVGLASTLSETRSAVTLVFGDAAADIRSYAENANTALGQTRVQALQGAQTFGVFGKSAGLTGKPLSKFSTGLVTLAADFASFFNTSPADAIDAIGAGLRGEAEPLRRYGVLLDDAVLKSRAMALGIYDGNGALTSQQRILAAQAEIMAQSAIAQGDFNRTSGGFANQQRMFTAALEDSQTKLGEAILPTFTTLLQFANTELIPTLNGAMAEIGPQLATSLESNLPGIEKIITGLADGLPDAINLALGTAGFLVDVNVNLQAAGYSYADTDFFKFWEQVGYNIADAINSGAATGSTSAMAANVRESMTAAQDETRTGLGTIKDEFTLGLEKLTPEVDKTSSDLFLSGANLIDGLTRGMKSKKSDAEDAAREISRAVDVAARSYLQVRSPSRLFHGIGAYVGQGFANGITDSRGLAVSAMQSMVAIPNVARPDVGQSTSAGGGGRVGGPTFEINGVTDPYVVAAIVNQALASRGRY